MCTSIRSNFSIFVPGKKIQIPAEICQKKEKKMCRKTKGSTCHQSSKSCGKINLFLFFASSGAPQISTTGQTRQRSLCKNNLRLWTLCALCLPPEFSKFCLLYWPRTSSLPLTPISVLKRSVCATCGPLNSRSLHLCTFRW